MSASPPEAARRRFGTAYTVTFLFLIIGNGPVLLLVAYYLRHVTLTPSTWRAYLHWTLVVGLALPLLIVGAMTVVSLLARIPDRGPRLMFFFGLFWSSPVLIANHNAISDLRHGPIATVERVRSTAHFDRDEGGNDQTEVWHFCKLTLANGRTQTLYRYAVEYSNQDPCHGIKAGDRIRLIKLPHVDEVIAIEALGSEGT